jgi:dCMP deaminase
VPASRPSINEYFMAMAVLASSRSTWPGTRVGAVVVRDQMVISTGYNGTPRGWMNELPKNEASKRIFCHAEENAIVQAARAGACTDDAVIYVSVSPCLACARMIRNAGIKHVYYERKWDDIEANMALDLLNALAVATEQVVIQE